MKNSPLLKKLAIVGLASLTLSGCASAPPHDSKLDSAQMSLQNALNDENLKQAAPEQLDKASDALKHARELLKNGAPKKDVDHYVYLATQRIKIAEQKEKAAELQKEIKKASAHRDQIMLEANQAKIERLKRELLKMKAKETNRGLVLTLGNVLFDLNKADLKPGGMRTIKKLAEFMQSDPKRNVMIEGYTDSTGTAAYNEKLSLKRAESVRDALVNDGINPQRIVTKGYGPKYPIASNKTADGRQQNRRVEIVISDEKGLFPKSR